MVRYSVVALTSVIAGIVIAYTASYGIITSIDVEDVMELPSDARMMRDATIGHIAPMTGSLSWYGQDGRAAVDLAVSDFNRYLETLGADWSLSVMHEDSETDPSIALEKIMAMNELGIGAIVGPYTSASTSEVKGYADVSGMIVISPTSMASQLAIPGDSVFRLVPDDTNIGPVFTKLVSDSGIDRLVAIQRDDTWGNGLYESTSTAFARSSGLADDVIVYDPSTTNFADIVSSLADIVSSHTDEVGASRVGVITISFGETLDIIHEAARHDVLDDVSWFCTAGIIGDRDIAMDPTSTTFFDATNMQCAQPGVSQNAIRDEIEPRLAEMTGGTPVPYSYTAYDAVWLLGTAILETRNTVPTDIRAVISDVAKHYSGASGSTALNEAGDAHPSNYDVWEIADSDWKIVTTHVWGSDQITP